MNCPICNKTQADVVMKSYDDRYGYSGNFSLWQCLNCMHQYLECSLSSMQLKELYTNYYPRKSLDVTDYTPHSEQRGFSAWLNGAKSSAFRWVPKNVRVLDIGCGFGQSLGYHLDRGCDVYGVEADENIRRVVDKFGFKVHIGLFDHRVYEQGFFDFVTMDQVIEHIHDPIEMLRGISRVLRQGGTVILSTPNAEGWGAKLFGKYWINWHTPYHLQFFTRQSMQHSAQQAGLELIEMRTVTNSSWLLYQCLHMLNYPVEGVPSCFWSPENTSRAHHQKVLIEVFKWVHRVKIYHLITRLFDSLRLGDNFVFILKKP